MHPLLGHNLFGHLASLVPMAAAAAELGGVSLMFNNDGNWTDFAAKPSALLFHEATTRAHAQEICAEHGESLLTADHFEHYIAYYQSLGQLADEQELWLDGEENLFTDDQDIAASHRRPFLCTNSAPHTVDVDTDFSSHPRMTVYSKGLNITGTRDHLAFRFMGIPYAKPPTGSLRFRYPQPFEGTDVDATGFKPACLQYGYFGSNDQGLMPWGNSEDCLYLNVFTPHLPLNSTRPGGGKAVVFWIHGGGNTGGTGADATFDGGSLASRADVVVVTINYRLNIFGFLGLADGVVTGNYALADKIAALQWVQTHITAFGGDPSRVMILGQSAGGFSVVDLVSSPMAAGLFSRAVSMSGGSSSIQTPQEGEAAVGPHIARYCPGVNGTERLSCLQELPAETVLNMTTSLGSWTTTDDGVYRTGTSIERAAMGPSGVNSVPYMAGFLPDEGQSLLGEAIAPNATDFNASLVRVVGADLAKTVIESGLWQISDKFTPYNATINVYTNNRLTCHAEEFIAAAATSGAFPSLHVYNMHWAYALSYYDPYNLCTFPVGEPDTPYYMCHSGDLYEVFGTYYFFDQPVRTPEDIYHTLLVQDMLGAFARTGDPNPDPAYLSVRGYESTLKAMERWRWPEYTQDEQRVAALRYSKLGEEDGLPDRARCSVLLGSA
ncbi:Alpha/Beta hydrolase protein [Schizophyllum amplum]|uniref:Carboxylic ester hydrolase n=1 Tax=Schizophyllum amplum TaxID=97359 RepID=A0A550BV97_9AGAR|nr:Alpha/Beta hydrolase protein [Auriculariopsis ampla]